MTNITKIIEAESKTYSEKANNNIGQYGNFLDSIKKWSMADFTAGADFATTDPSILQAILQPFAEWVLKENYHNSGNGNWLKIGKSRSVLYATEELIQKYFADNKQKYEVSQNKTV